MPGAGSESVSIKRLKPALASDEGTVDIGEDDQAPPSPPLPGRRPGVRTHAKRTTKLASRQIVIRILP